VYPTASDIFGNQLSRVKAELFANLTSYAERISAFSGNVTKAADLIKFFELQYDLLFDGETPMAEIIIYHSPSVNAQSWTLLPFSRGNIHITSSNTSIPAAINPNYFALEWDKTAQVATFQYIRKILSTTPLSTSVGKETDPGTTLVPTNASESLWFSWLSSKYRSNYHPVGSAAMLPQELGGVVDNNLKVYGTQNVRVMDASVLPFQLCGHLQSTLYAMAEKAADIIKAAS
jgi:choline dehydrogenase-like flavoprotein